MSVSHNYFEKQEELLLLDEYGSIDEKERIPLQSLYKQYSEGLNYFGK